MPAAWVTDDSSLQRLLTVTGFPDSSSARGYETMSRGRSSEGCGATSAANGSVG